MDLTMMKYYVKQMLKIYMKVKTLSISFFNHIIMSLLMVRSF